VNAIAFTGTLSTNTPAIPRIKERRRETMEMRYIIPRILLIPDVNMILQNIPKNDPVDENLYIIFITIIKTYR